MSSSAFADRRRRFFPILFAPHDGDAIVHDATRAKRRANHFDGLNSSVCCTGPGRNGVGFPAAQSA